LKQAADAKRKENADQAAQALKAALPVRQNPEAIDLLMAHGLSRDAARRLISDSIGKNWLVTGTGRKADPMMLRCVKEAAGNDGKETSTNTEGSRGPIPAGVGQQGPQESMFKNGSARGTSDSPNSCGSSRTEATLDAPPDTSSDDDEGEL